MTMPFEIVGARELERTLTRELNKISANDDRISHLCAISDSESFENRNPWQTWPKAEFEVTIELLSTPDPQRPVKYMLDGNTIRLNRGWGFIERLEPRLRVGPRIVSYAAMLCADAYTTFRYGVIGNQEKLIEVASTLEIAIFNHMIKDKAKDEAVQ